MMVKRWWLCYNPAFCNEYPQLELSRAWEPSGTLGPLPTGEGKATQFGFLNGNQI
jgi:hypothetical protein